MSNDEKTDASPVSPKQWGFVPVETAETAARLFAQAFRSSAPLMIWSRDHKTMFEATVFRSISLKDQMSARLPRGTSHEVFLKALEQAKSKEVFICLSLPSTSLFFKTVFHEYTSDDGLIFSMPQRVFKVQRRRAQRWEIRTGYVLKMEFEDPLCPGSMVTKKIHDISEGGVSFLVPDEETVVYPSDTPIRILKFTLKMNPIRCEGIVRHVSRMIHPLSGNSHKVGIEFVNLPDSFRRLISHYVNEEMMKLSSRYL